jgi:hypothetical protein
MKVGCGDGWLSAAVHNTGFGRFLISAFGSGSPRRFQRLAMTKKRGLLRRFTPRSDCGAFGAEWPPFGRWIAAASAKPRNDVF